MRYIDNQAFEERFLSRLNPQQREAVQSVEGSILLLATPGSGKTTVLVTRLGYMICTRGIAPDAILTMTYTRAATRDMRRRFVSLFGEDAAENLQFRTINGVCVKIIERYCAQLGRSAFTLLEREQSVNAIIRTIYQKLNGEYAEEGVVREIRTQITYVKNMMLSSEEIQAFSSTVEHFPELYQAYQTQLRSRGLMDYDDQMVYALSILRRHPQVLESFQNQFRYVCVDEAQDTSKIQHELIKLLSAKQGNLFLVGDEDQSIYGFRAAYPEALLRFEQDHPGAKILFMEQNYRSTPEIIALANRFISENVSRREKTIQATRSSGEPVRLLRCKDRRTQFSLLLEMARSCQRETAILYRNNDSGLPLMDLFLQNGIAYNSRNTDTIYFFTNRVVTDVLSILRFGYEPDNGEIFLRIYYKFDAKISKKMAQQAVQRSESSGKPILEELLRLPELKGYVRDSVAELMEHLAKLRQDSAETALSRVWEAMHYGRYVRDKGFDTGKYFILSMLAEGVPSVPALEQKLESLKRAVAEHQNDSGNQVILSTIHSSKGLEYDRVYLLDVLDGILPAVPEEKLETDEDVKAYEEERRLFYVGMTRARRELYLFNCNADASFIAQSGGALPAPVPNEQDLFDFLRGSQLGKLYHDREWGTGEIVAQWDDQFYVSFRVGILRRLSLAEMVTRRDRRVTLLPRSAARGAPKSQTRQRCLAERVTESIGAGTAIRHKAFGPGVVRSVSSGIVTVAFESGGTKRFVLRDSLSRGLLYL